MSLSLAVTGSLRSIVGDQYFIADPQRCYSYVTSISSGQETMPDAVVLPASAEEVAAIVKICNDNIIPIMVRGGGTGVSAGHSFYRKGIILSLERLNKILEINRVDRVAVAEAGVVTADLQREVAKQGLCFPQNISSSGSSFIGGNIAVASGSPKSLKYGPTRGLVLNLQVVLPNGEMIWTGRNVSKNATGFNLTQLIAGSEGTLGIITKAVLQLVEPMEELLVLAPFSSVKRLFEFANRLFIGNHSLSSIEFLDRGGYELVSRFVGRRDLFKGNIDGLLWLEFEGRNKELLLEEAAEISQWIGEFTGEDMLVAQSQGEIKALWELRSRVGEAVVSYSRFRDIDIVVPRSKNWEIYHAIKAIADGLGLHYIILGHIGNGNFHVNIFQNDHYPAEEWLMRIDQAISAIFRMAVDLGGTLSGEHGIGAIQWPYLKLAIPELQLDIMKQIKRVFDPNDILNAGKIFEPC